MTEPELSGVADALGVMGPVGGLPSIADGHLGGWLSSTLALMEALERSERDVWRPSQRALGAMGRTVESEGGEWGGRDSHGETLVEVADLADCADICVEGNLARPHARDMVRRF